MNSNVGGCPLLAGRRTGHRLRRLAMLVIRVLLVVEDGLHVLQRTTIWIQPNMNVLRFDVDNRAVVSCSSYLRLRIIRNGREGP